MYTFKFLSLFTTRTGDVSRHLNQSYIPKKLLQALSWSERAGHLDVVWKNTPNVVSKRWRWKSASWEWDREERGEYSAECHQKYDWIFFLKQKKKEKILQYMKRRKKKKILFLYAANEGEKRIFSMKSDIVPTKKKHYLSIYTEQRRNHV